MSGYPSHLIVGKRNVLSNAVYVVFNRLSAFTSEFKYFTGILRGTGHQGLSETGYPSEFRMKSFGLVIVLVSCLARTA